MAGLARELYPICRSITGPGIRLTLEIIGRRIPLQVSEIPSGTPVLDWVVPNEWNIEEAYIAKRDGTRIVDFARHNLYVLQYSQAVDRIVPVEELRQRLYSIPDHPDWIPYRTSYYKETWGFCLAHSQLLQLNEPDYHVVIKSSLAPGSLTYGECIIEGEREETVLISCHICHPSLANDNLSGIAVATSLAQVLRAARPRFTYRFLFIPGTIGSITWLAKNESLIPLVTHGLVLSCLGDAGLMTYKRSRRGDAVIDKIAEHVFRQDRNENRIRPFTPYGYDERQYCSPGFNMPIGCLMRTPNGEYPEYHSSADDLSLLRAQSLEHSLEVLCRIVEIIEGNGSFRNLSPKGEPQLGKRGLYTMVGGNAPPIDQFALLWVLNLSDTKHSLLEIAEQAQMPFASIRAAADALVRAKLLEQIS